MNTVLESLALTLLHFGWQALLIAAAYWLADKVLLQIKPGQRYMLSLGALVAMMACGTGTFVYEILRLAQEKSSISLTTTLPVVSPTEPLTLTLHRIMPWLDGAWLIGVAALSLRTASGLWFIHTLKKHSQPVSKSLQNRFTWLTHRMGLTDKVMIRLHPAISGPFVVGIVKSVVYLPVSAVSSLSPEQLDAVLSHELEHIRRADFLWNLIQTVVETLFFYHPAVWWIGGKLREQRELCCDDAAISACADPLVYATALLTLEEQRRGVPALAMALNGQDGGLLSRIARMLGEKTAARKVRRNGALLALPVLALALTAFAPPVAQVAAKIAPEVQAKTMSQIDTLVANTPLAPTYEKVRVHSANFTRTVTTENGVTRVTYRSNDPSIEAEAEAAAQKARADAIRAKQALRDSQVAGMDAEAAAKNARESAQRARDNLINQGYSADEIDIDPDAIAEEVRSSIEEAKANVAEASADSIDPDAIAEAVRQAHLDAGHDYVKSARDYEKSQKDYAKSQQDYAKSAQAYAQSHANYAQNYNRDYNKNYSGYLTPPKPPKPPKPAKPCRCEISDAADIAIPETPAPLMDEPLPPAPPVPAATAPLAPVAPVAPTAPLAFSITIPDGAYRISAPYIQVDTKVKVKTANTPKIAMLGALPAAKPSPLPSPDPKTDVVVTVR